MTAQQDQVNTALHKAHAIYLCNAPATHRVFFVAIPCTGRADSPQSLFVTDAGHAPKDLAAVLRTLAEHFDPRS